MGDERIIGGQVPRGVEVLINKAAVDTGFRKQLLADRHGAAEAIALELTPSENLLLNAIPNPQLEMIIDKTVVPEEHRPAFLGMAAKVMLVAIATMAMSSCYQPATRGIAPERPVPSPTKNAEDPKTGGGDDPNMKDMPETMPATDVIRTHSPLSFGHRMDRPAPEATPNTPPEQDGNKISSPKGGSRPDRPVTQGVRPDRPAETSKETEK